MFTRKNVAVRISSIQHRQMEREDYEVPLVEMCCEVNPCTAELAQEVHDFVRGTLYTMSGAEVNSLLGSASFALQIPPQAIDFRTANDAQRPALSIDEAKISDISATRTKKSTAWTLKFKILCSPASDKQLGKIAERYLKTSFLTFAAATPGLFDETPVASSRGLTAAESEEHDEELPIDETEQPATH